MNGRAASCVIRMSIGASCLHASASSRTKCRRLSSRFSNAASRRRWQVRGGVSNHVGAKVPPRPATRSGPTSRGRAVANVVQVGRLRLARFPRGDAIEVFVVAFDPEQRRGGAGYAPVRLARSPTQIQSGTSGCRSIARVSASKLPWMSATAPMSMNDSNVVRLERFERLSDSVPRWRAASSRPAARRAGRSCPR